MGIFEKGISPAAPKAARIFTKSRRLSVGRKARFLFMFYCLPGSDDRNLRSFAAALFVADDASAENGIVTVQAAKARVLASL